MIKASITLIQQSWTTAFLKKKTIDLNLWYRFFHNDEPFSSFSLNKKWNHTGIKAHHQLIALVHFINTEDLRKFFFDKIGKESTIFKKNICIYGISFLIGIVFLQTAPSTVSNV